MLHLLPLVMIIIANDIPIFILLLPNLFCQTKSFSILSVCTYHKHACIMYQNTSVGLPTVFPEDYNKALLKSEMQQKKQFCFLVYFIMLLVCYSLLFICWSYNKNRRKNFHFVISLSLPLSLNMVQLQLVRNSIQPVEDERYPTNLTILGNELVVSVS